MRLLFNVNCLENSTDLSAVASVARRLDPNYSVTFAVNSADSLLKSPTGSANLFQDGTVTSNVSTDSADDPEKGTSFLPFKKYPI